MLSPIALACPQCAAPLPREARWRTVTCSYCGSTVVRGEETVERANFRAALERSRSHTAGGRNIEWRSTRYQVLSVLGHGDTSEVLLVQRRSNLAGRLTVKLLNPGADSTAPQREYDVLRSLQALQTEGAAYFTRRLPQPVGTGQMLSDTNGPRAALVLQHPAGYWGSLAAVMQVQPDGIDPRHAVWIWRRMLEVLSFVHASGWTHGALTPEHALVHPYDHAIQLIDWKAARFATGATHRHAVAQDLRQTAWTLRAVLHGGIDNGTPGFGAHTPPALMTLLQRCSEGNATLMAQGADGIRAALTAASEEAYGSPKFIPFIPAPLGA